MFTNFITDFNLYKVILNSKTYFFLNKGTKNITFVLNFYCLLFDCLIYVTKNQRLILRLEGTMA